MSAILTQILLFMASTFLLGLVLGYVLWRYGSARTMASMSSDLNFWKDNLEQSRIARESDIRKIEELTKEKAILKKRLETKKP